MKQPEKNVLEVKNLSVSFHSTAGEVQAVRDVSFSLKKGEVLAIVGESDLIRRSSTYLQPKATRFYPLFHLHMR